ncbi:POK18 protein, partial [Eurystomus gularis]|nr:POK18 protein [Eurystomus gularis]
TVTLQPTKFNVNTNTLNDAQKLLGNVNWVRPYLGLSTEQLSPSFALLKGDPELTCP